MSLSSEEIKRYARHLGLSEVGKEGQEKLKNSGVLIIGAGGLGSPAAIYLAAAGVGTIGLVDFDCIEESNLQRQVFFRTSDIGKKKVDILSERIEALNPHVRVQSFGLRFSAANAMELVADYDVVLDGTDNFSSRYLINDACVFGKKPNVSGSIFRFEGQLSVFDAQKGPCYRCLYPDKVSAHAVPSCAEGGVLGVLPGVIGSLQAMEAIKLILEVGESLRGRLMIFDGLSMSFRTLTFDKNKSCPVCSSEGRIKKLVDESQSCSVVQLSPLELKKRLDNGEEVFLLDVRESVEYEIAHLKAHLIPLNELVERVGELDAKKEIVVYCHHGIRSSMAAQFLLENGFKNVKNLTGGIDEWAEQVDLEMERY